MWACEILKNTCKNKKWMAIFENHFYLNSTKWFPKFRFDVVIVFAHRTGNAYAVKILHFMRNSDPEVFRPATLSKRDPGSGVFQWIVWNLFFLQGTSCGCFCFMATKFFVFQVEAFQFSEFYENMGKLSKCIFQERLDPDIQDQKLVKLLVKVA